MPNLRERKKADTRTRLAVAAVELLVAVGAEGATVSAIAGRAGVSTRTFHNYFAHREDAFVHFLREQVGEWVRQMEQAPAGMSPLEVLHSMFREINARSADDVSAAENLLVVGEQIGVLLSAEARSCIADEILDPLYEAVSHRVPRLSRFRVRVMVDLGLAAGASVLRHRPSSGHDPAERLGPSSEQDSDGVDGQTSSPTDYLGEAFDLLEHGTGREFQLGSE